MVVIAILCGVLYLIYIKFIKKNPLLKNQNGSPKGQELLSKVDRVERLDDEEESKSGIN